MNVAIIGGGPAGLMAAEILANAGASVIVYDRKPSLGRKFLMAGRGGLNLTHSEPIDKFLPRYGTAQKFLTPILHGFSPEKLRAWCEELGQETFVGSSGRVFPKAMKASPLLRAWLNRLDQAGVQFKLQRTWKGFTEDGDIIFDTQNGMVKTAKPDAVLLALGGASWPSLGSDGAWTKFVDAPINDIKPSNCGFVCRWSDYMKKYAGTPLKNISVAHKGQTVAGEAIIAENGMEGGAIYALSASIRENLPSTVDIDLRPNMSVEDLLKKMNMPRGRQSFSTFLQKALGLSPVAITLLREADKNIQDLPHEKLATLIKSVPLRFTAPFSIERAISSAGGIDLDAIDHNFMIKNLPSVFAAGEMLDWEAPTGGYLLQACFATGVAAANGIMNYLKTA